jgi:YHS domain-containing protein
MINLRLGSGVAACAALAALLAVGQAHAAPPVAALPRISVSGPDNVAIKGYDPVAYFLNSRAELGSKTFTYRWSGATWEFSSATHLAAFKANPDKYVPQYGGYSAYAVAENAPAAADPRIWTVLDGKLYLNTSEAVRKLWLAEIEGYIETADANWTKIEAEAVAASVAPLGAPKVQPVVQPVSLTSPAVPTAGVGVSSHLEGGKLPVVRPN